MSKLANDLLVFLAMKVESGAFTMKACDAFLEWFFSGWKREPRRRGPIADHEVAGAWDTFARRFIR